MSLIRLASRDNFRDVEQEWQWEFVFYVLEAIGLPENELSACLPEDGDVTKIGIKEKVALRQVMHNRDVTIQDDHDGGLKIYVYIGELEEHLLVAEWKKCTFVYREDPKEVDPHKRIFVEVHADVWTSFEEDNG